MEAHHPANESRPITVSVDVKSAIRVTITCMNKTRIPTAVTLYAANLNASGMLYQAPADIPARTYLLSLYFFINKTLFG